MEGPDAPRGFTADPPPEIPVEGPVSLRVEEAVLLAVAHNRDLLVRRFDPTVAATFAGIERGAYDPEVFVRARRGRERTPDVDRVEDPARDARILLRGPDAGDLIREDERGRDLTLKTDSSEGEVGLRQTLPTGTEVELSAGHEWDDPDDRRAQRRNRIGITVTQALLRGFAPASNLAEIRRAELDAEVSEYELRAFAESVVAEAEIAYWRTVLAARRIAIFEESLRVAEKQRDDTLERIEVGTAPRSDAAATRSEVARRRQDLIGAEADLIAARLRLWRQVAPGTGWDPDRPLELTTEPPAAPAPLEDPGVRTELALRDRPELGEARLRLAQRRLDTVRTANGMLPRLDFFVGLGRSAYGEDLGDSLRGHDAHTYDLTVGVDFSYRLGDRAAAARHVAAVATTHRARAAIANLERLVEFEVRLALTDVERARELAGAAARTAELQEETLRAERERLAAGAGTPLLVAQAQRDLVEARVARIEAAVAHRVALVRLHLAEGSLLARRGIGVVGE